MIIRTIDFFDLKQIADSGQCFRMAPLIGQEGDGFRIISRGRLLDVFQQKRTFSFHCSEEDMPYWEEYFDLKTDYGKIAASAALEDTYLQKAALFGSGIRILRQEPWEMIITFIISQQKTIPKIKESVELLSRTYGKKLSCAGHTFYAFPSPEELSSASLDELLSLKLGYRAKYIYHICQDAISGRLDLHSLSSMDYFQAMDYLTGFYGIGRKVADCICLFGLHHINAFPIDTWIQKILLREYYQPLYEAIPKKHLYQKIVRDHFSCYEGFAGVMQQYIFYYERYSSSHHSLL
ncbi:DNA glycosylase [Lachnospiraceae bacterium 62-35]